VSLTIKISLLDLFAPEDVARLAKAIEAAETPEDLLPFSVES